jgi:hypothetical protein
MAAVADDAFGDTEVGQTRREATGRTAVVERRSDGLVTPFWVVPQPHVVGA